MRIKTANTTNPNTNPPADKPGPVDVYAPEPLSSHYPGPVGTWVPGDARVVVDGERVTPSTLAESLALGVGVTDDGGRWAANGWTGNRAIRVAHPVAGGLGTLDECYPGRVARTRAKRVTRHVSTVVTPASLAARIAPDGALSPAVANLVTLAARAAAGPARDKIMTRLSGLAEAAEAARAEAARTALDAEIEAALAALDDAEGESAE